MNYLAHSFLAFSDEHIVGQFLDDYIINKDRFLLPKEIYQGIVLHRETDTFTDQHPVISEAKKIFSPLVRLYSGAFVDVVMDYFLAHDTTIHSAEGWKKQSAHVYSVLEKNLHYFPEHFKIKLSKMKEDDWLYNYREDWGIKFSIQNVLNKSKYLEKDLPVFKCFVQHKDDFKKYYEAFFPDLLDHIKNINASFE